jgi:flavin reductase (DIM6/NTAB) family NADH-FMN oxidoreductase RutF
MNEVGEQLRVALRGLARAVMIVTSFQEGTRYAMSATAVSEMSWDPASMLVCINRAASIYAPLKAGAPFSLNILHDDQTDLAINCSGRLKGEDRFQRGQWIHGALGVPQLVGAQSTIACRNAGHLDYGTHSVFVGDVIDVVLSSNPSPLIYLDGRFLRAISRTVAQT